MFLLVDVRNPSGNLHESGQPGALMSALSPLPPVAAGPEWRFPRNVSGEAAFHCESGGDPGFVRFTLCHGSKVQLLSNASKQLCHFLLQISKCNY